MKLRVRNHYRVHKLSFWLHLVPDLQKNSYGVPSAHHSTNVSPFPSSRGTNERGGGLTSHPNSGLVILPPEDPKNGRQNSSTPPPPTIQLVGPPMWEHNPSNQGSFFRGSIFFSVNLCTNLCFCQKFTCWFCVPHSLKFWFDLLIFIGIPL